MCFFFFKQKAADVMRISDWSSDVCSSDLTVRFGRFWYDGANVLTHRWAAEHIHGLPVAGRDVIPDCGNPLCVQHLSSHPSGDSTERRKQWVYLRVGLLEPEPSRDPDPEAVPFFLKPDWLRAFDPEQETNADPF